MVVVDEEAQAFIDVATRYAAKLIALAQGAAELNAKGFRTRHGKAFTSASVRFLLDNPYCAGRGRYRDKQLRKWQERPGLPPAVVPPGVFAQIHDRI